MTGEDDGPSDDDSDGEESGASEDLEDLSAGEGDDDDDEDIDVDAAEMAKSLAELEKKDPEFYKYLQENDAGLLDFDTEPTTSSHASKKAKKSRKEEPEQADEDASMDEYDAPESDEDEEEPELETDEAASKARDEPQKQSVTMDMLRAWQSAMIEVGAPPRVNLRSEAHARLVSAQIASIVAQDDSRFPCRCTHERG